MLLAAGLLCNRACDFMNTVHVLIAYSDRRLNNLIEVAVRDVCYEQLLVECEITSRLDELRHRGCSDIFGLIFVAPNHLVIGPAQRARPATLEDASECIKTIKQYRAVPIIAVGVRPDHEMTVLETGADSVFGILFDRDKLRFEIRRGLGIQEAIAQAEQPSRWSFASGFLKGFHKLRQN